MVKNNKVCNINAIKKIPISSSKYIFSGLSNLNQAAIIIDVATGLVCTDTEPVN